MAIKDQLLPIQDTQTKIKDVKYSWIVREHILKVNDFIPNFYNKIYWLLGKKSKLSVETKLVLTQPHTFKIMIFVEIHTFKMMIFAQI